MKFCITRTSGSNDFPEGAKEEGDIWVFDVQDLNALVKLIDQYSFLVLQGSDDHLKDAPPYKIEIYDTYRE